MSDEKRAQEIQEIKEQLVKLHEHKPDYVFVCEATMNLPGHIIKEAWKGAYPDEKQPKFFRVDPRTLMGQTIWDDDFLGFDKKWKHIEQFFKYRIKGDRPKVIVWDECYGDSLNNVYREIQNHYPIDNFHGTENERFEIVDRGVVKYIGGAGLASISPTGEAFRIASKVMGVKRGDPYPADHLVPMKEKRDLDERHSKGVEYDPTGRYYRATMVRGEYRQGARDAVRYGKQLGREAGEELHTELEQEAQKKSLEQKVSSVVAIAGLVSSLFFTSSNITGNAIGNISRSSGSWLGIGLFLVGIAGTLFYFRSK